jgi:hypothetical protein
VDLENLEPPPETAPGYYPDPLGGSYKRWWDGTRWVAQVGPRDDAARGYRGAMGTWMAIYRYGPLFVLGAVMVLVNERWWIDAAVGIGAALLTHLLLRLLFELAPDLRGEDQPRRGAG